MRTGYVDLIDQTFDFPQEEFTLQKNNLFFHGVDLMELVNRYGSPLKFTYLPKISDNINRARTWFADSFKKHNYEGKYHYAYCTKSSHFKYVLERALQEGVHLETSSAFDINIIENLYAEGKLSADTQVLCNGYKPKAYVQNIARLINDTDLSVLPIIDNKQEIKQILNLTNKKVDLGIRIASEEEPKFPFYTSRLGIGYRDIVPFYKEHIEGDEWLNLKMLHFFINTGINDNSYYWNELHKCLKVYIELKKVCPTLSSLDIGGGFPIKNSLAFDFDYAYIIDEIVHQISVTCKEAGISVPDIYTEFGSFTVGESGGAIYQILAQKRQNDREKWNMIDSSFITTLPDSWAINKRFILLAINNWDKQYERVLLGGLTCDSDDYYNSEQHINAIYLPQYDGSPQYIGFFNTGAYQDTVGGFGGLQHCLIPKPKHVLIDKDKKGKITHQIFAEEQSSDQMLKLLGFDIEKK